MSETRAIYWESQTDDQFNYAVEVLAIDAPETGHFYVRILRVRKYLNNYETWRQVYLDRVIIDGAFPEARAVRRGITDLDFLMSTWVEEKAEVNG